MRARDDILDLDIDHKLFTNLTEFFESFVWPFAMQNGFDLNDGKKGDASQSAGNYFLLLLGILRSGGSCYINFLLVA